MKVGDRVFSIMDGRPVAGAVTNIDDPSCPMVEFDGYGFSCDWDEKELFPSELALARHHFPNLEIKEKNHIET